MYVQVSEPRHTEIIPDCNRSKRSVTLVQQRDAENTHIFFLSRLAETDASGWRWDWAAGALPLIRFPNETIQISHFSAFLSHPIFLPLPHLISPLKPFILSPPLIIHAGLLLLRTRFPAFAMLSLSESQIKFLPLSSLRKAPLGESGILPHRLLGLGKSMSVLRVCSLNRQYLHRDRMFKTYGRSYSY